MYLSVGLGANSRTTAGKKKCEKDDDDDEDDDVMMPTGRPNNTVRSAVEVR